MKTQPEREWYIRQTVQNGWSRNVLVLQIESGLYRRQGKAQTNFSATLPAPQSDLAQQVLKDPYNFDFLMLAEDARERERLHRVAHHPGVEVAGADCVDLVSGQSDGLDAALVRSAEGTSFWHVSLTLRPNVWP